PNCNLLLMVRVAESIKEPIREGKFRYIRWSENQGYVIEEHPTFQLDTTDPRKFRFLEYDHIKVFGLTSFSWLLPVELSPDGLEIVMIHYDKIIEPQTSYQEYGVEDPRITKIENTYYMTSCSVSSERHSTTLYSSENGLDYTLLGIIMDHQNKDMVLFPEKINGKYYALTRPLGELYFTVPGNSDNLPGPSINLAESPDLLHWKPFDKPYIRAHNKSLISLKLGAGAPPVKCDAGWLILYHGVDKCGPIGCYRTYYAIAEKENPENILFLNDQNPLLESSDGLTQKYSEQIYLNGVVFTTGIEDMPDYFIIASGELDLLCRITHIKKSHFNLI
ncbi:MAG: glycosidase, partial [Candidatus Marinimicrobia bacterium]|nr:glycosidase [Candidatus Neomarinimicrobiota bacterium]